MPQKMSWDSAMKVALISSGYLPVVDGVTVTLHQRLQYLSQQGHDVLLLCPDYSSLEAVYPDWRSHLGTILPQVRVVGLASMPFMDLEFERNFSKDAALQITQELEQFQPDMIQVDEPERIEMGLGQVPGLDYARRSQTPCLGFYHTHFVEYLEDYFPLPSVLLKGLQWYIGRKIAKIYNQYDATLVASRTAAEKVAKMGIRNSLQGEFLGVDLAQFDPQVNSQVDLQLRSPNFFAEQYGITGLEDKIKVLFLGRLTPDKGWNFLLNVLPLLMERLDGDRVAFLIAGDGQMRSQLEATLKPVLPHVHFLGRISPDAVPAYLCHGDLHVTGSEKETRGLTILEAFAAGIPVLAPHAGGAIDTIQDGETGYLFTPGDRQDFLEKLAKLIQHSAQRQQMGMQARSVVERYSWHHAVDELVRTWQSFG
jgi:glycosyltransferase involved in cell wall biosynthesis